MTELTLDNLTNELYQALHTLATQQNQSLSEAAVDLLTSALTQDHRSPAPNIVALLTDLHRDRESLLHHPQRLDSTILLREDRDSH
jgi:plasmid stability protein